MKILSATAISWGLARGKVWIAKDLLAVRDDEASDGLRDAEAEGKRLDRAFDVVRVELRAAAELVSAQMSEALAEIFNSHELMLDSLLSSREFHSEVESGRIGAELAVQQVFQRWEAKFLRIEDPVFRSKADDLTDLFRRILHALRDGATGAPRNPIPAGSIMVTRRLLPSDVIPMSRGVVAGVVVETMGKGSHAALLLREKGIPAIAGGSHVLEAMRENDEVLVDATRGQIIFEADQVSSEAFATRLKAYNESIEFCRTLCHEPAKTLGGTVIGIMANIGNRETAEAAVQSGADGVGLFRLEQLYLGRDRFPDGDELLAEMIDILKPLRGKPVTIRLLDIGGDKLPGFMDRREEANSLLGRRGVRFLLAHPELARLQLRALLRLSKEMEIKILVPLVTLPGDMQAMRSLFDELVAAEAVMAPPPLGAMIETPAAALRLEDLCRFSDFFSIGSNDLTQYTLAAARENPEVDLYYQDTHPAVLRLVKMIVEAAGSKEVTLCGELAGREEAVPQLVALGLRALSVAPIRVPFVKQQIRAISQ